jgi:hypothetical protein
MLRRVEMEIEADHVAPLLDEERVGREGERPGAVGLHPEEREVALDGTLADPGLLGDPAPAPVGTSLGLGGEHGAQERRHAVLVVRARPPAPRRVGEAGQALAVESAAPVTHRLHREVEARGKGGVRLARGRAKDDLRAPHMAVGQRARRGHRGELRALGIAQDWFEAARATGDGHSGSGKSTPKPLPK